jgi:hypothetical protein
VQAWRRDDIPAISTEIDTGERESAPAFGKVAGWLFRMKKIEMLPASSLHGQGLRNLKTLALQIFQSLAPLLAVDVQHNEFGHGPTDDADIRLRGS